MYHYFLYLFFIALLINSGASQPERTDGVRIFTNGAHPAYLISSLVSNAVCASAAGGFMYITNDGCANIAHSDGTLSVQHCDSRYNGITSLMCTKTACHATNPTATVGSGIIAIDPVTATVIRTYGSGLVAPYVLSAYEGFQSDPGIETFVIDSSNNSVWLIRLDAPTFASATELSQIVYDTTSTGAPLGVYLDPYYTLYVAYVGDADIATFSYYPDPTSFITLGDNGPFSGGGLFTSIDKVFFVDAHRLYVYDNVVGGCDCVQVYSWYSGVEYETLPAPASNLIKSITSTLDHYYVLDTTGILQFTDPLALVTPPAVTDMTCQDNGGKMVFNVKGGALPVTMYLYPDNAYQLNTALKSSYKLTFNSLYPVPDLQPWYIMKDFVQNDFLLEWYRAIAIVDNVTAQAGNASFSVQFQSVSNVQYGRTMFACNYLGDCITDFYTMLQFQIDFGAGGQEFLLQIESPGTTIWYTQIIRASDYSSRGWNLIQIPLRDGHTISRISFIDNIRTSAAQNPFWIDEMVLLPVTSKNRRAVIIDACGATLNITDNLLITHNNTFSAALTSTPVTCNIAQPQNAGNTTDGTITAVATNGFEPFLYTWNFPNIDPENATVYNISSMNTFITIYDNAVNSSGHWFDTSSIDSRNMTDSSRYVSPPYSMSMTFPGDGTVLGIAFTVHPPINVNEGSTLTFWVNGGDYGGQRVKLMIYRYSAEIDNNDLVNFLPFYEAFIPPNVWKKMTYTFPNYVPQFTQVAFIVDSLWSDQPQPTIYFDDLILNVNPTVSVMDDHGCTVVANDVIVGTPLPLEVQATTVNALCFNSSDGHLRLNVTGGVSPYSYSWNIPNVKGQRSFYPINIDGLPEMNALVDITDSNGCSINEIKAPILQPPALDFTIFSDPIKCKAGTTKMTSYIAGGMAPYTYSWSASTSVFITPQPNPTSVYADTLSTSFSLSSNLQPQCLGTGSHLGLTYKPTHAGYCALAATFTSATPAVTFYTCSTCLSTTKYQGLGFWIYLTSAQDAQNLFVTLFTDGTPVSTPLAITNLGNITTGTWSQVYYNVSLSSSSNPDQIVISSISPTTTGRVLIDDVVLFPAVSSSVGVVVYSGFKSIVSGGAGLYFLTVVDANGCSFVKKFTIEEPDALDLTATIQSASTADSTDGSIVLNTTGGTPPYKFKWLTHNNATNASLYDLPSGEHTVLVTDANGCTYENSFFVQVEVRQQIRAYNKGLSAGLGAITGVAIIISLFALGMLFMFWGSHTKLGTFYSFVVTIGVLLSYIAVLMLLPRPTDALCTAFPWLLGTAFTLVYGCLFLKTWALYRVWIKAIHYQRATLTTMHIVRTLALALAVEFVVLGVWTASDPPKAALVKVVGSTYEMQCTTNHSTFWIIFVAIKGVWLLFGAILSVLTRNVMKEYNESTSIAYAIYNILVLLVIAIPLAALLGVVPGGRLVIEVVVPVLAFTSTLVIMFFKIWHAALFTNQEIKLPGMRVTAVSPANTTWTGGSNNSNSINSRAEDSKSVAASTYSASVS